MKIIAAPLTISSKPVSRFSGFGWLSARAESLLSSSAVNLMSRAHKEVAMPSKDQAKQNNPPLKVHTVKADERGGQTRVVFLSKSLIAAGERLVEKMRDEQRVIDPK